jgi:tRNA-splicing ligase RtcB
MDTNKLLRSAGIVPSPAYDYGSIAKRAAQLGKDGTDPKIIIEIVRSEFDLGKARPSLLEKAKPIAMFGDLGTDIDYASYEQINTVMRLPVAIRGALMPDAHKGYGMPIGGVAALHRAVSPSFVGYDIACRMMLTILHISPKEFMANREKIAKDMSAVSSFGLNSGFANSERREHEIMEDPRWEEIKIAKQLKEKAARQLGSSGGGNHFFDALIGTVTKRTYWHSLDVGDQFVAIMTHSGSRGTGHKIASYYQQVAKDYTRNVASGIPKGYAWLSLDNDAGREYWMAMQLMGLYAQANHELIHDHFLKRSGISQVVRHENHHNFAWLEDDSVIHRKGATPADAGQVGIIPGSSGAMSYLVEGLAEETSLKSSAHGAGRPFSRTEAKQRFVKDQFDEHMKEWDVLHIGVAPDESPFAYKDINRVMEKQEGILVRTVAEMKPAIVIMGGKSDDGD